MKVAAVIAEYNPFHNGHLYHIEKTKEVTGADAVVAVMSGDYVQRGAPAVMSKYLRTEAALKCGVSAVFELPLFYATASAELFAEGAVSLLSTLPGIDSLCFGAECGKLPPLKEAADYLSEEPEKYKERLRQGLKNGLSFPRARQEALEKALKSPFLCSLMNQPNNILGIEYLKALKKFKSRIAPFAIKRAGGSVSDDFSQNSFACAFEIRNQLKNSEQQSFRKRPEETPFDRIKDDLKRQVPKESFNILKKYYLRECPVCQNDFSLPLKFKLMGKGSDDLFQYMDVSKELADKIYDGLEHFLNYSQFAEFLKSKEITLSRISRALLHIMLDVKKADVSRAVKEGYHSYVRLLGVRSDFEKMLGEIIKTGSLPLLGSLRRTEDIAKWGEKMLRLDILATDLYHSVITEKYKTPFACEYRHSVVKE